MSLVAIDEIVKSGFKNVAAKTCDMNTVHIQVRLLNTITAEKIDMGYTELVRAISNKTIKVRNLKCIDNRLAYTEGKEVMPKFIKNMKQFNRERFTILGKIDGNKYVVASGTGEIFVKTVEECQRMRYKISNGEFEDRLAELIILKDSEYEVYDDNDTVKKMNIKLKAINAPYTMIGEHTAVMTGSSNNYIFAEGIKYIHRPYIALNNIFNYKDIDNSIENCYIPSTMSKITERMFMYRHINKIIISNGVKEIGLLAFSHASIYSKMVLPDSVNKIGFRAFASAGLDELEIQSKEIKIDDNAFMNTRINKLILPRGTTTAIYKRRMSRSRVGDIIEV